jgi:hypothetical protein
MYGVSGGVHVVIYHNKIHFGSTIINKLKQDLVSRRIPKDNATLTGIGKKINTGLQWGQHAQINHTESWFCAFVLIARDDTAQDKKSNTVRN